MAPRNDQVVVAMSRAGLRTALAADTRRGSSTRIPQGWRNAWLVTQDSTTANTALPIAPAATAASRVVPLCSATASGSDVIAWPATISIGTAGTISQWRERGRNRAIAATPAPIVTTNE